jgi:hypothetical protein
MAARPYASTRRASGAWSVRTSSRWAFIELRMARSSQKSGSPSAISKANRYRGRRTGLKTRRSDTFSVFESARWPASTSRMLPRDAQTCLEPERYSGGKGRHLAQGFRAGTRRLHSELLRMARDCWVEVLTCPNCRRISVALLSATDKLSWDFQVDVVPEGFKAIPLGNNSYFFCVTCDMHVEP